MQFYIYRHIIGDETIYIGSNWKTGNEKRAYERKNRCKAWRDNLRNKDYKVEIMEYIQDNNVPSKITFNREMKLIKQFKDINQCTANKEDLCGYLNKGKKHTLQTSINHTLSQKGIPMRNEVKEKIKKNAKPGKGGKVETYKVLCIETKKVYENLQRACEDTGAAVSNIRKVILGQRKTAGGYRWERV